MENKDVLSVHIMKQFIKSGGYRSLKIAEEKKKRVVKGVKRHLLESELRRQEFSRFGLVAKFTVQRDYRWDYHELNQYLADLGLLIPVATLLPDKALKNLEVLDMVSDFQLPVKSYTFRPYFNKLGKEINAFHDKLLEPYNHLELDMYLNIFDATQRELDGCLDNYEAVKNEILTCSTFAEKKKLKYEYGSMSLSENKEGYNINEIVNEYGIDFLIEYGRPNMNKLQDFILRGTISQQEVYQFRKDVTAEDKDLKFTLMRIEDEHKQLQMLSNQRVRASLAYDARKYA